MQNDHDDKYEPQEESEYHFTDEDVSYEAEHEPIKPAQPTPSPRENILKQFTQRRLIISGVVFLVLVFAVYKMIAPVSQPAPAADITAQAPPKTLPVQPPTTVTQAAVQPAPVMQPSQPALVPTQAAPNAPAATQTPVASTQPPLMPTAPEQVMQQPQITTTPSPTVEPMTSVTTTMPATPTQATSVQTTITTPGTNGLPVVSDQTLTAKNEQGTQQLSASVDAKLNEFSTLNQAMQTQIQTLDKRVAAMEAQLNQLVNVLTQQHHGAQSSATTTTTNITQGPQAQAQPEHITIPFNVQAIIPGRAWLKSSSGETLTVAEGDYVNGAGRVVKIDPYDGVVEINVGNRVVSLSYGATG